MTDPTARVQQPHRVWGRIRSAVARMLGSADVRVGALLAVVTTVLTVIIFRLWDASLSLPQIYTGDGTFYSVLTKGIEENGNYLYNDLLGYPKGLAFVDYPLGGDNLNLLLIRVVSWFSPNFGLTINLWVILTFPLVAVCAFAAMRRMGVTLWSAASMGLLYTFIQYHFRASGWLLLIGYFALPFGILLAVRVLQGTALFARSAGATGFKSWFSRRTIATLATIVAIGSTGIYLTAFTLALMTVAMLGQFAAGRPRVAGSAVVAMAAIVGMVVLNTAPTTLQRLVDGTNQEVPIRAEFESELYGITLTRMVIPPRNHRFEPAANFGKHFQATTTLPVTGEEAAYIGAVGLLGLGGLSLFALVGLSRGLSAGRRHRYGPLAVCAVTAFIFGTVGGANTLFSYLVSPALRGLGRISSVLAFCGLAAVAFGVDGLRQRLRGRDKRAQLAIPLLLSGLIGIGLYDQTANGFTRPYYDSIRTQWNADQRFVDAIENRVPKGAAIYTFPEQFFPESAGPGGMADYDSAIGYLHSRHLKWSYGAVRGRDGKWLEVMNSYTLARKIPTLALCGFAGVWFDRAGVEKPAEVSAEIGKLTGTTPIASEDARREFFALDELATRERGKRSETERALLCARTFSPAYVAGGDGVSKPAPDGVGLSRWLADRGSLEVRNELDAGRRVEVRITVNNTNGVPLIMRLTGSDATQRTTTVSASGATVVSLKTTLPKGRSKIPFTIESTIPIVESSRVLRASRFEVVDRDALS
jgi:hypothetical protein